jgi:hypothetical protein
MNINLDEKTGVLYIKPTSALTVDDFSQLSATLDPYLNQRGNLNALLIETPKFPGWANMQAFMAHVKFIKNHQAKILKIALVTDSSLANLLPKVIGAFVTPEIKHFPYNQSEAAKQWVQQ